MIKKRAIDKINRLKRASFPFTQRNQVEEKYFQEIQRKNKGDIENGAHSS